MRTNRIYRAPCWGRLIGIFADSRKRALEQAASEANEDGYQVVQDIPDTTILLWLILQTSG